MRPTRRCACIILTILALFPIHAHAHPQDGPHADVRARISDTAVTLNITVNLAFTDEICPALRESPGALHPLEEPALKEAIVAFLRDRNRVTIDGVVVSPRIDDFEILRPTPDLLPLFPNSGMAGMMRARLVATYPVKSHPRTVEFVWDGYPTDFVGESDTGLQTIEAQLIAEGKTTILRFSKEEPAQTWHTSGATDADRFQPVPELATATTQAHTLPILSIGAILTGLACLLVAAIRKSIALIIIAAGFAVIAGLAHNAFPLAISNPSESLSPEDAVAIFEPIHANIYRAFDYESESDIYDALARSVEGDLLETLYGQVYRSLIMYEEGGAVSRVTDVDLLSTDIKSIGVLPGTETQGFTARARWRVEGTVYHWGHSHTRLNEYLADYTVAQNQDGWRIAANTVIEQFRVQLDDPAQTPEDTPQPFPGEL